MMRRILPLLGMLLFGVFLHAQSKRAQLPWNTVNNESRASLAASSDGSIGRSNSSTGNISMDPQTLEYSWTWQDQGFANPASLQIRNVRYGDLTTSERNRLNTELVPDQLEFSIGSARGRDITYTSIELSPVIRENGQYKKVLSFDLDYSYQSQPQTRRMPITNSVLATGNWYKFRIDQTGVYRISRDFLNDLGMNTSGINPRNLKVYGHGGKPLPLINDQNTEFDLPENAIQVIGEEDGSFDSGDFILFYAEGTQGYVAENDSNMNPYSDEAYYYVTADGGAGRRIQPMVEPSAPTSLTITEFDDYLFHEVDDFSPAKVGRRWFGNRFDIENEQSYEFTFPNIVSGTEMQVRIKAASAAEIPTSMALSVNGTSLDPLSFSAINDPVLLSADSFNGTVSAGGETVTVDLVYNNSGNPTSIGYLDYISIEAKRRLSGSDGQLQFKNNDVSTQSGIGEYQISNASQFSQVWDVTNPRAVTAKSNEGGATLTFKATLGELRRYVAVDPNDYFAPVAISNSRVPNQDLKGTIFNIGGGGFRDIDMLIVTAPFLLQPALRLANHRSQLDGLNVKVVTTDKIYQEFSSGKQDIVAIRNFVRYIYENASDPGKRIKYLCMFGDASIDYKSRLSGNNNVVPVFHTLYSLSTFASYMTDDFFGAMDPGEGLFLFNDGTSDKLDIAVGRILADEVGLANQMVNKIENYSAEVSYGNWRNNFVMISDDVDELFEFDRLQGSLDILGDEVSAQKPFINVKKIHSDAFQQESSSGGDRYPAVNDEIVNAMEVGAVIVNYFGHGGEDGLASELIYVQETARNLRNRNRYPCVVTVTCEFTKFDNPLRITAGELTFWNREGGAISMVTTTRSIGVSLGVRFNEDLAGELFGFGVTTPNPPAEALRISKNQENSSNRRVIFYIGDPSMNLAFAKPDIRLTTLNGVPIGQATDTLQALSRVRIGGEVTDLSGNVLTNYNGVVQAKVFDKNVQRQTLGNDGVRDSSGNLLIMDFITLGEGLFNGQATVTNGQFEFEFVVPRDTQIPVGNGKVSFYASRDNALEDQTGANLDLLVGGLNENAPEDNIGPNIRLFMNDESFVNGGITNDSPILIAKLEDENGINTASGIGHDMIAILDGDEANPIILNEYYIAEVDDFTRGQTTYNLRDLEEGLHTLTFKAWDVYNNSSTAEIQFIVAGDDKLEITRVLNYPNPFVSYTEFWFNHNRPFEPLEVQVQVFTVTGKIVWTKNQIINTEGFLSRNIVWDGRDDFGDRIGKGTYVYKITVKSTLTNQRVEKFEKLVIL